MLLGVVVSLSAIAVVAVGAVGGFTASTATTKSATTVSGSSHLVGRWVVPRDETTAPVVPTPGGATNGIGSFNAISCPTSSKCVAVGGDGALNGVASTSVDGGAAWTQGAMDENEPELNAVDCESALDCVAVGDGAAVISTDGGETWSPSTVPTSNTTLLGVTCPSAAICVSVGVTPSSNGPFGGELLLSTDSGNTWSVPTLPNSFGALGSVDCPTAAFCVAVGSSIIVSTDGGKTWTRRTVAGGSGVLRSVSCLSVSKCVAVGANPTIAQELSASAYEDVTTDGGVLWSSVAMPSGSGTTNVISCSSVACVAAGSALNGTPAQVFTTTSGSNWAVDSSLANTATAFSSLSCYSATNCVFLGQDGTTPISVSTVSGAPTSTTPVASQVRVQKDVAR
jgi:photosystem II stability/assembly factor-like uncharacterized protein